MMGKTMRLMPPTISTAKNVRWGYISAALEHSDAHRPCLRFDAFGAFRPDRACGQAEPGCLTKVDSTLAEAMRPTRQRQS
jgi:hypothetical protein